MIFTSKATFSHYNFKILRHKVTKNLTNVLKKFCESPPRPVNSDHPYDHKILAVVDRWSLFRGHLYSKKLIKLNMVAQNGWRYRQVILRSGLTVFSVCIALSIRVGFCYLRPFYLECCFYAFKIRPFSVLEYVKVLKILLSSSQLLALMIFLW